MGTQETIIYRLVVRNTSFDAYFSDLIFFGHFWLENGRGHHARPKWSKASKPDQKVGPMGGPFGPTAIPKSCFLCFFVKKQDPTKKLAQWVDLLGQSLSRKHVIKIFGLEHLKEILERKWPRAAARHSGHHKAAHQG